MTGGGGRRRPDVLAVHSIDHFAVEVPDLGEARRFYETFGLDVRGAGNTLELFAAGSSHRWAILTKGEAKKLLHLSFGIYAEDEAAFAAHLDAAGARRIEALTGTDVPGIWFEGFDGLPVNLRVAGKSSPDAKSEFTFKSAAPGTSGAIPNSKAPPVRPRRLSHFALFSTDVGAAIDFYARMLGLRLSDRSGPAVAFMHGAHGSDHHLLALVMSDHRGMHHNSWDVGSLQEVGLGGSVMARAGYDRGWGLGQHVLGANYFYYVRDPWGSYSEYSADIDYIPADCDWPAGDHPPEDSMFLWGPNPSEDFILNTEPA